jgi:DNA anti-recombination protein RmuC
MNVAKALVKKARLSKELADLHNRVIKVQKTNTLDDAPEKIENLLGELDKTMEQLVNIKSKIVVASLPVIEKIVRQSELKKLLASIKKLDTSKAKEGAGYGDNSVVHEFNVQLNDTSKQALLKEIKKDIDDIQDQLDTFNATTLVE